jgi:hypothetical protein
MAKIYLDTNVYINIIKAKNKGYSDVDSKLRGAKDQFFFSNGHSEELLKLDRYDHVADYIDELTCKNSIRMDSRNLKIVNESIFDSIERCKHPDTHDQIVSIAQSKLSKEQVIREKLRIEKSQEFAQVNQICTNFENIWSLPIVNELMSLQGNEELRKLLNQYFSILGCPNLPEIQMITFENLRDGIIMDYNFGVQEIVIDLLSAILSCVGYGYDKNIQTAISGIYDTTHMIMSRYCDIVVSTDKSYVKKTEAIFWFLGIKTKVILMPQCMIENNVFVNEQEVLLCLDNFLSF